MATKGDAIKNVAELVKRVAEQKWRRHSNAAALEAAREQIRARRRFIPKQANCRGRIRVHF